jgi:hypothetical protein
MYLSDTEAANGLGNRFLFAAINRAQLLPSPRRAPRRAVEKLARELGTIIAEARQLGEIRRNGAAEAYWKKIYPALTQDYPGLVGQLLARSEAHVARLSALLARAKRIGVGHLQSALAAWAYVEASTRLIFGDRTGNDVADRIRQEMLPGQSLTLTELRDHILSNHVKAAQLLDALKLLVATGEFRMRQETSGGRPRTVISRLKPVASEEVESNPSAQGKREKR